MLVVRLIAPLLLVYGSAAYADCDPEQGRRHYAKCAACHAVEPDVHGAGASLAGVVGRIAGTQPGFLYSEVLTDSQLVWDTHVLSAFLKEPQTVLPGNVMPFGGMRNDGQRADLICYLATL